MDRSVEIYYLRAVPHGRPWVWMSAELLVIEAALNCAERRAAIDEAFADLRARTLADDPVGHGPVGHAAA